MSFNSEGLKRGWCLTVLISLLAASVAWSATTGRVAGTVVDAEGSPLPGVGVTIQGTRLGATTDANGRYFILQVHPGQHTVTAQLIGFRPMSVTQVRVSADLTTEVNFRLQEEAIEIGETVVTARREVIDADVTSSQITIDASSVAEMPVSQMLNLLSYEPGVSVNENNELNIRGGGPSEIQFQVDGMARTDAITNKGQTQINQVLVAEVTVLTGGFNAEYGNVRSGVVNAVLRDGSEGGSWPNIQGAITYAPAQQKHFGPGAYDEDQYDYWVMSSVSPFADPTGETNNFESIIWPDLYEVTANHTATQEAAKASPVGYRALSNFAGWGAAGTISSNNMRGFAIYDGTVEARGSFNKDDWTAEELREAWEYEANMNEQAWEYAHEPDISADLAASWALPNRLGGIIFGYSYNKIMTAVPAVIPYARDVAYDAKLTLNPIDELKFSIRYYASESYSTGAGNSSNAQLNPELTQTGAGIRGSDPVSLRSSGDIASSLTGTGSSPSTKLNLSTNAPLTTKYNQIVGSFTYTIGANMFLSGYLGRSHSDYSMERSAPRANVNEWSDVYVPNIGFSYAGLLNTAFGWTDVDGDNKADRPTSMEDALNPDRVKFRSGFQANFWYEVPEEGVYEYKDFANILNADGEPTRVVSPQGYSLGYRDLSLVNYIGGGGEVRYAGNATNLQSKFDVTFATGSHTFKTGVEFNQAELEYHWESVTDLLSGSIRNTEYRDYGGNYPTPEPTYLGIFVQDKFESQGMIANLGFRVERFNSGQDAFFYNNFFEGEYIGQNHGTTVYNLLDLALDGVAGGLTPEPWDIINYETFDRTPSEVHWRIAPRFGISHPVSTTTKFFFNFGQFYSAQKSSLLYGIVEHDAKMGAVGKTSDLANANLRPSKTTAYEAGVEHVFPWSVLMTVRGYAKFNTDQVSSISVSPGAGGSGSGYKTYRNRHFEDIRGMEIKIARTGSRFINGWFTYQRTRTQEGYVGVNDVCRLEQDIDAFTPWSRDSRPNGSFQATLILSTPRDWGAIRGGWSMTIVQDYSSGGETYYNPDPSNIPLRELPEENWFPQVDTWNTDLRISKTFDLPGSRYMSVSFDVSNLWNTKRLNGSLTDAAGTEYSKFIYEQRKEYARRQANGESTEGVHNYIYGEPDTFYIFTEPWQSIPDETQPYKAPLQANAEWLIHMNPRYYRLGLRFSL